MRKWKIAATLVVIMVAALVLTGCPQDPAKTARDGAFALNGYVKSAQTNHPECSPANHPENQTERQCVAIAKGISVNNVLKDALNVYCSGPEYDANTGPCQPPAKGTPGADQAASKLNAALRDLQTILPDIQALAK